jgi:breast cancer 2 susceptibility protein
MSTEKKEPSEVLEAYNSTKLILAANSSHPVAWHTKLGFTRGPCISTLHKLDPHGGLIAALDLVIIKVSCVRPNRFPIYSLTE